MKEEEAKTKWCPNTGTKISHQGNSVLHPNEMCIASDCMCWKWDEAFNKVDKCGNLHGGTNYNTEGHCGLTK